MFNFKLDEISNVFVQKLESDLFGGGLYRFKFPHYVGSEPNGYIPWNTAGNLPPMEADLSELKGCRIHFSVTTIQNGTDPLQSNDINRGFRLVAPGGSKRTRWLNHNESSLSMRNALLNTVNLSDINVSRIGPFESGSYEWLVTFSQGFSWKGQSWKIVRSGGGSIDLKGTNANAESKNVQLGKFEGYFSLMFDRDGFEPEQTNQLPISMSDIDLKESLEKLESITEVNVYSTNQGDSGAKRWDLTFVSLKDAGDLPLLRSGNFSNITPALSESDVFITEKRKGVSNEVLFVKIPLSRAFKFSSNEKEGKEFLFSNNTSTAEVTNALNDLEKDAEYFVEIHMGSVSIDIFILPLAFNDTVYRLITAEVFDFCDFSLCFSNSISAEIWVSGTTQALNGSFAIEMNLLDCNFGVLCSNKTKFLPIHSSIKYIEEQLETIPFLKDVIVDDVGDQVNIPIKSGKIGRSRHIYVHFKELNTSVADVPMLRLDESRITGSFLTDVFETTKGLKDYLGGPVSVDVSINGGIDFSDSGILFLYYPVINIISLHPSRGPSCGGSKLILHGNFTGHSHHFCHFESHQLFVKNRPRITIGSIINKTHLLCETPPSFPGKEQVSVSIDGMDTSGTASSKVIFTYDEVAMISNIVPSQVPSSGNNIVQIFGGPFPLEAKYITCKFGNIHVLAVNRSKNMITCIAPQLVPGVYFLEVGLNGQDFTEHHFSFLVYDDCIIDKIMPESGPASGSTQIQIIGRGFFNSTYALCKFGTQAVTAFFVNEFKYICYTPSLLSMDEMRWSSLSSHEHQHFRNTSVFPYSHHHPLFLSKLKLVEFSMVCILIYVFVFIRI